jgi:hypothetical protein
VRHAGPEGGHDRQQHGAPRRDVDRAGDLQAQHALLLDVEGTAAASRRGDRGRVGGRAASERNVSCRRA